MKIKSILYYALTGMIPIGAGVKLATFLDNTVHFPFFPNIFDCICLIIAGSLVFIQGLRKIWVK